MLGKMLKIENLCFSAKTAEGEKVILDKLSLEISDKHFVVVTGPNGSGKTTLARLIMGAEKPDSGKITWNGRDLTDLSVTERARLGVSYGFQQPPRFKGLTVNDLLKIAAGREMNRTESCAYLTQVGLCARDYVDRDMRPQFLDKSNVDAAFIAKEKEIRLAQAMQDPQNAKKPEQIIEKIVMGGIEKYYKEICLLQQEFVKDNEVDVAGYVARVAKEVGAPIVVKSYVRYEKGEGIEKRQDDLAAEVAKMIG